jgi:hypothetical protein
MCASHGRRKRHPVRKTAWFITAAATVIGGVWLLWVGSAPPTSTHHAQIQVELPKPDGPMEARLAEHDRILKVIDAWAGEAGLDRVPPEQAGSVHLAQGIDTANGNERITWFREAQSGDPSWPIEVMVAFDPDAAPVVEITVAEGYHKQPSPRLHDLYRTLLERLKEHWGDRIVSSGIQ